MTDVPAAIAMRQKSYERKMQALAMRKGGKTYVAIGRHFGVSPNRAGQMVWHATRFRMSPVEAYNLNHSVPEPLITSTRLHHRWLSAALLCCESWDRP